MPPPAGATDRVGRPRRRTRSAAGQRRGGHDIHGRLRGLLDMLLEIVHANRRRLAELPWPEHTHHVTSENGWARTTTILQLAATLDNVLNPSKEGQSWIPLWDMASSHASEATLKELRAACPHVVQCFLPQRGTPCDVAVFRSFKSIQTQASATLGVQHVCKFLYECLDVCLSGNRP